MYVNAYSVDRRYGGPEEGGWWYDDYTLIGHSGFIHSYRKAEKIQAAYREHYKDEQPRYNRFSVIGGPDILIFIEETIGESETRETPHYE